MGCLEVNTSMKVLDFDTRSAIAKECINRLCEASDRATTEKSKSRKTDPRIGRMLSDVPCLENAGTSVQLTITSLWLKLSDLNSGNVSFWSTIFSFNFSRINFRRLLLTIQSQISVVKNKLCLTKWTFFGFSFSDLKQKIAKYYFELTFKILTAI